MKSCPGLFSQAPPNPPLARLAENGGVLINLNKCDDKYGCLKVCKFWNRVQLCMGNYWRVVREYRSLWQHMYESLIRLLKILYLAASPHFLRPYVSVWKAYRLIRHSINPRPFNADELPRHPVSSAHLLLCHLNTSSRLSVFRSWLGLHDILLLQCAVPHNVIIITKVGY